MARRRTNVFGLAFLDAMTCGLGAVVLLYMVINANVGLRAGRLTSDLTAEVDRLQIEVLEETKNLVELRNSIDSVERERVEAQGLSRRILERMEEIRAELATFDQSTLAEREHINRLQADLRSLEEAAKRLSAGSPSDETPGDRLRSFIGDGDRQYLTGLKVGGERILILLDRSASMLDETIVNIVVRRNLPDERKVRAAKWRRAVATVDWLTTRIPRGSRFQIYEFSESARSVLPESAGRWLDGSDAEQLNRAVAAVRALVPGGGTNLYRAFEAATSLEPRPDNVLLIVDGLPTQGRQPPRRTTVSGRERLRLFNRAVGQLPSGVPVNVILFPMEGDPRAPSAYWKLAMATRGSFLSPPEDWP